MAHRQTTTADYEQRLLRAQELIRARLDEPIDLAEVAGAAHFSLHHFHRIFRAQLGESVMQHVRRLRLERAARRLRHGEARLLDLALEAGYQSHEAFTRAFVDRFGVPPSRFREQPSGRLEAWEAQRPPGPGAPVRVATYSALQVAFMRHRGGYATVGETWQRMMAWVMARVRDGARPALYGICPDDPEVTEERFLRFDACAVVEDGEVGGEVSLGVVPGGTYAVGLHVGPYDRLHETYLDVIGRWFPTSGYEPAPDAVVEHYLNDPSCASPSELKTEVRVRIADQD